jgi:hypothetical protein
LGFEPLSQRADDMMTRLSLDPTALRAERIGSRPRLCCRRWPPCL